MGMFPLIHPPKQLKTRANIFYSLMIQGLVMLVLTEENFQPQYQINQLIMMQSKSIIIILNKLIHNLNLIYKIKFLFSNIPKQICSASRTALLTGRYSWLTRMNSRVVTFSNEGFNSNLTLLPELFDDNNFNSYIAGKWYLYRYIFLYFRMERRY